MPTAPPGQRKTDRNQSQKIDGSVRLENDRIIHQIKCTSDIMIEEQIVIAYHSIIAMDALRSLTVSATCLHVIFIPSHLHQLVDQVTIGHFPFQGLDNSSKFLCAFFFTIWNCMEIDCTPSRSFEYFFGNKRRSFDRTTLLKATVTPDNLWVR